MLNLAEQLLLEKKLEQSTFCSFFHPLCFLPKNFRKKCLFWDRPKSGGRVRKNEFFEKIFFSKKNRENTKTKVFRAFWVKKNFLKFFFLGKFFRKFFSFFLIFFFKFFRGRHFWKLKKSEKIFEISEIWNLGSKLHFSERTT